jgi:hypothetical protein
MPYLNKRNRFIQAAKTHAESNGIKADEFKKSDLLAVANSINMKGIPTWVLKECKSSVSHRVYDLTVLFNAVPA